MAVEDVVLALMLQRGARPGPPNDDDPPLFPPWRPTKPWQEDVGAQLPGEVTSLGGMSSPLQPLGPPDPYDFEAYSATGPQPADLFGAQLPYKAEFYENPRFVPSFRPTPQENWINQCTAPATEPPNGHGPDGWWDGSSLMASGGLFSFNPAAGETPETLKRRRAVAEAMMSGGAAPTTIGGGLSSLGSSIAGALMARGIARQEAAGQAGAASAFSRLLAGFGGSGTDALAGSRGSDVLAGGTPDYRSAIAGLESGGRYDAIGPTNAKLGRPLGKYQVMEANLAPWSQAALGRTVTPDEFLADPKIQDAIFDAKFGEYVKQYGPEGAARAWLGGRGAVGKTGRKDVLGTSVGDYGEQFTAALGGTPAVTRKLWLVARVATVSMVSTGHGSPPGVPLPVLTASPGCSQPWRAASRR